MDGFMTDDANPHKIPPYVVDRSCCSSYILLYFRRIVKSANKNIKKFLGEISVFESRSWNWSSPDKQKHGLFFVVLSILPHRCLTAGKLILFLNGRRRFQKQNQVF